MRLHFWLKRLHYNLESRRGSFGGFFPGRFFTISTFSDFWTEFEISMEFMPTARATHEHSPNICRDTKRLMTAFAIFDYVIFHRYYIGKAVVTIKQRVAKKDALNPGFKNRLDQILLKESGNIYASLITSLAFFSRRYLRVARERPRILAALDTLLLAVFMA